MNEKINQKEKKFEYLEKKELILGNKLIRIKIKNDRKNSKNKKHNK